MQRALLSPVRLGGQSQPQLPATFSISTWNVWFDKHHRDQRFRAILEILRTHDPHIMAFQEVTLPFVRVVQESEWLRKEHWISAVDHNNLGTLLISRVEPEELAWVTLPTRMGRRLLTAEFAGGLRIATCHLESLPGNGAVRREQLQEAIATLKPADSSLLLGDFNFPDGAPEAASIASAYQDAWLTQHPDSEGYTWDTVLNGMARLGNEDKQQRLDRIFFRGNLEPAGIQRLGTEPIGEGLFPSDHFGLLSSWTMVNAPV